MRRDRESTDRLLLGAGLFVSVALLPSFGGGVVPPEAEEPEPAALSTVPVPLPDNLSDFVVDMDAALKLGKALFWDMQVGSDGVQACASCHFAAGVDPRVVNQINPGTFDDNLFDVASTGEGGPNTQLTSGAWPFHKLLIPDDNESEVLDDFDDAFASQGVKRVVFSGVNGTSVDDGVEEADPDGFSVGGLNVRRVEPRNTPTVINAVFFHRLFHDGRANHFFNGEDPFGNSNSGASVLVTNGVDPAVPQQVLLNNAALASQAVGPPGSPFEMSWDGRNFDDIGEKMLTKAPLAHQMVHPEDSVFQGCVNPMGPGLTPGMTYADMVMSAFDSKYWSDTTTDFGGFSQMEKNFDLFFGLALLVYESTLVADDTPLDRYLEGGGEGGTASDELTAQEKEGLDIFLNRGDCNACHTLPELGGAALSQVAQEGLLEFMAMENTGAEGCLELSTDPEEPGVGYLPFDPRSHVIDIMGPVDYATGDWGTSLSGGLLFFPGTNNGECWDVDAEVVLQPWSGVPYHGAPMHAEPAMDQEFGVSCRVKVSKDDCRIDFEVCIETGFPGITPGDYVVVIDGAQVGFVTMPTANPPAVYDSGFYNIGATPTSRDIGNGASGPFGPFALAARVQNGEDIGQETGLLDPLLPGDRIAIDGAFRAPHLRNIELTGPYMHNGGLLTLEQVVDFYTGGGHFLAENIDNADPEVAGIGGMDAERKAALAAFMKRPLTDERVRWRQAPFDHPQLFVPDGHQNVQDGMTLALLDDMQEIQAVGRFGAGTPLVPFHERLSETISVAPLQALHVVEDTGFTMRKAGKNGTRRSLVTPAGDDAALRTIRLYMHVEPEKPVFVTPVFDSAELYCEPAVVEFSEGNWFEAKEVRVYALRDRKVEGDRMFTVGWDVRTRDMGYLAFAIPRVDVMVSDPPSPVLEREFEAESAILTAPMQAYTSTSASGGEYVSVPDFLATVTDPETQAAGRLRVEFDVSQLQSDGGEVYAWLLKRGNSWFRDSVWIRMDGVGSWELFEMQQSQGFTWQRVSIGGQDRTWDLDEGAHFLELAQAEAGVRIDRIVLTNDANYDPTQQP